jgi:hypothetical protein
MYQRYHMLVLVHSDQLGLRASRTATRPIRSSCWRVVVLMDRDGQGRAAAATTNDIERVSLARAVDRAPERDRGYLMDHRTGDEPPDIHWP